MTNKKISAILFAVLFAVQAFFVSYIFTTAAVTSIPIAMFIEMAALVVFGVVCAKLFANEDVNTAKAAALTAMYIFLNGIYYTTEAVLAQTALSLISETLAANTALAIAIIAVRIILLIVAVVFCGKKEKEPMNEEEVIIIAEETAEIPAEQAPAAE